MITLIGCTTTEEALEAEQEIPTDKKVTLDQEIDEEETSVSSNEETEVNKQHSTVFGQSEETCYVDADTTKSEIVTSTSLPAPLYSEFSTKIARRLPSVPPSPG